MSLFDRVALTWLAGQAVLLVYLVATDHYSVRTSVFGTGPTTVGLGGTFGGAGAAGSWPAQDSTVPPLLWLAAIFAAAWATKLLRRRKLKLKAELKELAMRGKRHQNRPMRLDS